MTRIAASLLAADAAYLGDAVQKAEQAGVDAFHIDVMDGHFAPNIALGPDTVRNLRRLTSLPFDVHLMLANPQDWIDRYVDAGADALTVHAEAGYHLHRSVQRIKEHGLSAGVALNPATPLQAVEWVLDDLDLLLIMSVNPGYSGQKFITGALDKVQAACSMREARGVDFDVSVDGGVNKETAGRIVAAGANVLVCGAALFYQPDVGRALQEVRQAAAAATERKGSQS